jgi:hypothetical protein
MFGLFPKREDEIPPPKCLHNATPSFEPYHSIPQCDLRTLFAAGWKLRKEFDMKQEGRPDCLDCVQMSGEGIRRPCPVHAKTQPWFEDIRIYDECASAGETSFTMLMCNTCGFVVCQKCKKYLMASKHKPHAYWFR